MAPLSDGAALRAESREQVTRMSARERAGIVYALLCAVNGGFVPAVANVTTRAGDPMLVTVVTTWFAGAAALSVLALRGRLARLFRPSQAPALVVLGALGTSLAFTLFFAGAARASAIETLLCLQIEPVYALVLSWVVLKVRPTVERIAATGMILSGLLVALGLEGLAVGTGTWYLLATPLCWQVSHLVVLRWLGGTPADVLAAARYLWGGALLTIVMGWDAVELLEPGRWPAFPWGWVALQGLVLSYGGTMLWYSALTRIDLARATVLVVPTVPILSLLTSLVLVGEVPSSRQVLGVMLTVVGVYVFARRGVVQAQTHAPAANGTMQECVGRGRPLTQG